MKLKRKKEMLEKDSGRGRGNKNTEREENYKVRENRKIIINTRETNNLEVLN